MTLDSYLRDLLGSSSGLQVRIVNDNACKLQDESSSTELAPSSLAKNNQRTWTRSTSLQGFQGIGKSSKKASRWEGQHALSRNKSDSALGKPQRRSSADGEQIWSFAPNQKLKLEEDSPSEEAETAMRLSPPSVNDLHRRLLSDHKRTLLSKKSRDVFDLLRSQSGSSTTSVSKNTRLRKKKGSQSRSEIIKSYDEIPGSFSAPPKPRRIGSREDLTKEFQGGEKSLVQLLIATGKLPTRIGASLSPKDLRSHTQQRVPMGSRHAETEYPAITD